MKRSNTPNKHLSYGYSARPTKAMRERMIQRQEELRRYFWSPDSLYASTKIDRYADMQHLKSLGIDPENLNT